VLVFTVLFLRKRGGFGRASMLLTTSVELLFNDLLCNVTWRGGRRWGVVWWNGTWGSGQVLLFTVFV